MSNVVSLVSFNVTASFFLMLLLLPSFAAENIDLCFLKMSFPCTLFYSVDPTVCMLDVAHSLFGENCSATLQFL